MYHQTYYEATDTVAEEVKRRFDQPDICITVWRKTLTVEKSDEFDEWILNRQTFPYQNFALKNFRYTIYNYF